MPPGFAHGFYVTSDRALFLYKCTAYYAPSDEGSVLWNDPDLAIDWPLGQRSVVSGQSSGADPILAPKDAAAPRLAGIPGDRLPQYH